MCQRLKKYTIMWNVVGVHAGTLHTGVAVTFTTPNVRFGCRQDEP